MPPSNVLPASTVRLDASELRRSLTRQATIRGMELPAELESPAPSWASGYHRAAAQARSMGAELRNLPAALAAAGRCLNPVLSGDMSTGIWQPHRSEWT